MFDILRQQLTAFADAESVRELTEWSDADLRSAISQLEGDIKAGLVGSDADWSVCDAAERLSGLRWALENKCKVEALTDEQYWALV